MSKKRENQKPQMLTGESIPTVSGSFLGTVFARTVYASTVFASIVFAITAVTVNVSYAETRGLAIKEKSWHSDAFLSGTYRALIIGNDHYQDPKGRWSGLKTAVSDAKAVKSVLIEQYGFTDVALLENATRREVLVALQEIAKRVMRNDSVLVYYAGHGFLDEETKKGYWVPVDAVGNDQTTYVRNSTIRDELTTIAKRAQHTLLISDSCFSGSLLRQGSRGVSPQLKTDRYIEKVAAKKSVQIMAAGGVEYVDDNYNDSGHSPFTYFFLNELKYNDQTLLTASEIASNVERAVANNADQIPENGVLQGAGDELGEFIFIKVKLDVEGIAADRVKVVIETDSQQIPFKRDDANTKQQNTMMPLPSI